MNPKPGEYWEIMRPECRHVNYFKFTGKNMWHTRVPILTCQCELKFLFNEAASFIGGVCNRIEARPLVVRQAVQVELENPHAVET